MLVKREAKFGLNHPWSLYSEGYSCKITVGLYSVGVYNGRDFTVCECFGLKGRQRMCKLLIL